MNQEIDEDECNYYTITNKDFVETNPVNWLTASPPFVYHHQPCLCLPIPHLVLRYFRNPEFRLPPHTATSGTIGTSQWNSFRGEDNSESRSRTSSSSSWASFGSPPTPPPMFAGHPIQHSDDDNGIDENEGGDDSAAAALDHPDITTFETLLRNSINSLGGAVIPKVNWKTPKDARWIGFNKSLKCFMPGDIFLLLKSSSIIDSVLSLPLTNSSGDGVTSSPTLYNLTLFQWNDHFSPEFEFRCFVANKKLILISQRDETQGFHSIAENRDRIIFDIYELFRKHIYSRFPLDYYVFDVVRLPTGQVILIDFNVYGLSTYPSLTSYKELKLLMIETDENLVQALASSSISSSKHPTLHSSSSSVEGKELKDTNQYGSPYFRYVTESAVGKTYPHFQAPLPVDVVTYLTEPNVYS